MRRWLLFATALLIATAGAGSGAWAATTPKVPVASARVVAGHKSFGPGKKQILRLDPKTAPAVFSPRISRELAVLPVTAKINVTYLGFPAAARTAFQAAVNIWETQIHSTVPIDVTADWSNLTAQYGDPGVLGAAGPTDFVENFTNAPLRNVAYPIALANAIAGSDQLPANVCTSDPSSPNPSGAEISASFNSDQSAWYYGTDGHPGPNQVDLESVVLHELGHGLGFVGSYDVPGNPNTGVGDFGLTADGQNPTIFDTFTADGSGALLDSTYPSGSLALGNALRGADGGIQWEGAAGDLAAGATKPQLYAPNAYQEGSSFSHLDEALYPAGNANALMTPALQFGEVEHAPGPIMLGMFKDMGWPQTGSPPAIGNYHPAAPRRLVSARKVTSGAPLTVQVTGIDAVPANATSVAVTVTVQSPTRTGIWSVLPSCTWSSKVPDAQNFLAGQTRTAMSVVPVDSRGRIELSLFAPSGTVSGIVYVDLIGWYASGGVAYHQLATEQRAFVKAVSARVPVDFSISGVAGIPKTGVTAVVFNAGVIAGNGRAWLVVGPGGVTSKTPTTAYDAREMTSTMAIVPVGSGAHAGTVRVRLTGGSAIVVLTTIGWYGPSTAGGLAFHSAGPAHLSATPHGREVTIGGLPGSTTVLLGVHLGHPTASGWLGAAPGGCPQLGLVQEYKVNQSTSGTTIVTTNAAGQVRLRLSAGAATFYTDFDGWFGS